MSFVLRDDADGVATLTLNRPEKLNALNPATFKELRAHLDDVAADAAVRCLVLTGAGRSFCAGNDLDAIASGEGRAEPMLGPETVSALEELPQPTIAKIKGHCFTGGLELALACDFLIAADSTKLGDTHGQWGMVPIWGMSIRLPERVGLANAKDMMFTARRIDGTRAKEIGLVDQAAARRTSSTPSWPPWPARSPPTPPAPTGGSSCCCASASTATARRRSSTSARRRTACPRTWPSG